VLNAFWRQRITLEEKVLPQTYRTARLGSWAKTGAKKSCTTPPHAECSALWVTKVLNPVSMNSLCTSHTFVTHCTRKDCKKFELSKNVGDRSWKYTIFSNWKIVRKRVQYTQLPNINELKSQFWKLCESRISVSPFKNARQTLLKQDSGIFQTKSSQLILKNYKFYFG